MHEPEIIEKRINEKNLTQWIIIPFLSEGNLFTGGIVFFEEILFEKPNDSPDLIKPIISETITSRDIVKTILQTQEEERKRIAEALHNELGQLLYAIKLRMESVKSTLNVVGNGIQEIDELLEEAIQQTRSISFDLTPRLLEDFGLQEAIEELCKRISSKNLALQTKVVLGPKPLDSVIEIAVFRIMQELINNIIKHSQSTLVKISLQRIEDVLFMSVEDNGIGFDITTSAPGLGLKSIKNRVDLLNGKTDVVSEKGKGTKINIQISLI